MRSSRQNIIEATQRILQTRGLTGATTREIAREAKITEGLIYHHFKDKAELIYDVVETLVSETKDLLQNLPLRVGTRTLRENLEEVLYSVYKARYEITPIICAIFADRKLHARMLEIMQERGIGPQHTIQGLIVYLAAEQRMGRLSDAVDAQTIAKCLLFISMQAATNDRLMELTTDKEHIRREIHGYVQILMTGLSPFTKGKDEL
jgi:AcrR family transcriptional regulator